MNRFSDAALPQTVRIDETGEVYTLPSREVIRFGRISEHEGQRANEVVLRHPDAERATRVSRWHFELRRTPTGLVLHSKTDQPTEVDGVPVRKGGEHPVREGSVVRVANALTLRFGENSHASHERIVQSASATMPEGVLAPEVAALFEKLSNANEKKPAE